MEEKIQKEPQVLYNDYYLYEKIGKMESDIEYLKDDMNKRFDDVNRRFDDVNRRFDDGEKRFDRMYILMGLGFAILATLISVFKFL